MSTVISQWYWATWLFVMFGVPETLALATGHPECTLSETAWHWFDVIPGQSPFQWKFSHYLVSVLLFWLWLHISFKILR